MRRKLFTAVSVLSVLLCFATVVLWVRSYFVKHNAVLGTGGNIAWIGYSGYGDLSVGRFTGWPDPPSLKVRSRETGLHTTYTPVFWFRQISHHFTGFGIEFISGAAAVSLKDGGSQVDWDSWILEMKVDWSVPAPFIELRLSYLWVTTVTSLPSMVWIFKFRRFVRRRRRGECPTCSYSLTGNTSGTCPECGTAVPASAAAAEAKSSGQA